MLYENFIINDMNALIIANGSHPSLWIVRRLVHDADVVICVDGGANYANKHNIVPDVILGDFDSISPLTKRKFRKIKQLHIKDQDSTDLEKAISYCIKKKIDEANIIGAFGDRIDHTTGSLGCFKKFRGKIVLRFVDDVGVVSEIKKSVIIQTTVGEKTSLIPLDRCTGVTTKNLLYSLKNGVLELGVQEGISNVATSTSVTINV